MTRLNVVSQDLTLDEYRELSEFRHQIRCFQNATEQHARELGVNLDSFILLLAIQGLPEGVRPTVDALSDRMCLSRQEIGRLIASAVEHGDITRSSPDAIATEDWVKLTRTGREALRRMALASRDELERSGPELVRALLAVVRQRRRRHRGVA
jgi:DNA-binding MarR family transcriptional regulator